MKLVNFYVEDNVRLGIKTEKGIIDVEKAALEYSIHVPSTVEQLIFEGEKSLLQLEKLVELDPDFLPEENLKYAPAISNPEKIVCVGFKLCVPCK